MAKYVCPICDQPMTNKHFCTKCGSIVKEPYIREANYFLNERHPEYETECSYHMGDKVVTRQQLLDHMNGMMEDEQDAPAPQQASIPNQPRAGSSVPQLNMEDTQKYLKNMTEFGHSSLHDAAELLKGCNIEIGGIVKNKGIFERVNESPKTQGTKKVPTLVLLVFFFIFLNIFSGVIVPFLRYIMDLLS